MCSLLCTPLKEFHVKLLKNPIQKMIPENFIKVKRLENDSTMAKEANVVHLRVFIRKAGISAGIKCCWQRY